MFTWVLKGKELRGVHRLPFENADFAMVVVDLERGIPLGWHPPQPRGGDPAASSKASTSTQSNRLLSLRGFAQWGLGW